MSITIFTTPKPFVGLADIHQRNAIGSWMELGADVIVFTAGQGDISYELGIRYIADIRNRNGLPYVNAMYERAQELARNDVLIHANADVIFLPDLLDAVERASLALSEFLMCGQRWDVELNEPLDFKGDWRATVKEIIKGGELHSVSGKDWFAFARPLRLKIPDLLIGRAGWDNWVLDTAIKVGIPVIDATTCVTCVHPRHDYGHLPGGIREAHIDGAEAMHNKKLANVPTNKGRISEATWMMTLDELKKKT
jgi:hypothetical protein